MFTSNKKKKKKAAEAAQVAAKEAAAAFTQKRNQAKASAVSEAQSAFQLDSVEKAALQVVVDDDESPSQLLNETIDDLPVREKETLTSLRRLPREFEQADHFLSNKHHHFSFGASHEPVLEIEVGEVVHVETLDCFGGKITPSSPHSRIHRDDMNPVTGPIYVKGAQPGDILSVKFHNICPRETGVAMCGPSSGQLCHTCQVETTRFFSIDKDHITMQPNDNSKNRRKVDISFPLSPMLGVVGVAPKGRDCIPTMPAGKHGGNLDNKLNTIGSVLHLPVQHAGALLSLGDMHASQGDGEICGTGVEVGGDVLLSCRLLKAADIKGVGIQFPVTETTTHWATHGVTVKDIPQATKVACEEAQQLLVSQWGFTPEEAFMFLSVAGDLGLCQACHPDEGTQIAKMVVPKVPACPTPFRCQSSAL